MTAVFHRTTIAIRKKKTINPKFINDILQNIFYTHLKRNLAVSRAFEPAASWIVNLLIFHLCSRDTETNPKFLRKSKLMKHFCIINMIVHFRFRYRRNSASLSSDFLVVKNGQSFICRFVSRRWILRLYFYPFECAFLRLKHFIVNQNIKTYKILENFLIIFFRFLSNFILGI